jgi:hypothetical protein
MKKKSNLNFEEYYKQAKQDVPIDSGKQYLTDAGHSDTEPIKRKNSLSRKSVQ